jgi:hypothetical protein
MLWREYEAVTTQVAASAAEAGPKAESSKMHQIGQHIFALTYLK